jgi:integrase
MRDLSLWPETVDAIKKVPHRGNLLFYTKHGKPMITVKCTGTGNTRKYTSTNMVTTQFSRLIRRAGLQVPKGTGFYGLRRTAATLAARSGDPFAVQRLLGHVDLKMATRYVQDVSKQTDEVIEKSRKYMI